MEVADQPEQAPTAEVADQPDVAPDEPSAAPEEAVEGPPATPEQAPVETPPTESVAEPRPARRRRGRVVAPAGPPVAETATDATD